MKVDPIVISSMEEEVISMVAKGDDGVYFYGYVLVVNISGKVGMACPSLFSKFVLMGHATFYLKPLSEQIWFYVSNEMLL
jgi:hypothetical protein